MSGGATAESEGAAVAKRGSKVGGGSKGTERVGGQVLVMGHMVVSGSG